MNKKIIFLIFNVLLLESTLFCLKANNVECELSYLHTDRTTYVSGETVYYKLYVLNNELKTPSAISKVAYVLMQSAKSEPAVKIRIDLKDGIGSGQFEIPDTLASGIYQLIAYTANMRNYGEDSFFKMELAIINRFDNTQEFKISKSGMTQNDTLQKIINTDKNVFNQREVVKVKLNIPESSSNISVSVSELSPLEASPSSFLKHVLQFDKVHVEKNKTGYYTPEKKGQILVGYVVDSLDRSKRIKNAIIVLSCLDSVPNLQYAVTDSNGKFQLLLTKYYEGKELFLTVTNAKKNSNWIVEIKDEFNLAKEWDAKLDSYPEDAKDFILKSQNIAYINKSYPSNEAIASKSKTSPDFSIPKFFHSEKKRIVPAEYEPLNNFLEIAIELLPLVRIAKDDGQYVPQIYNELLGIFYQRPPAVFVDGVYLDDMNKIIQLSSDEISYIDIISDERAFGDLIFGGLISISTKTKVIYHSKPARYSYRVLNDVGNDPGVPFQTKPLMKQHTYPFYKQLLYWNPEIMNSESNEIEFYTSDNLGKYEIRVEGIQGDGKPLSDRKVIEVINVNKEPAR